MKIFYAVQATGNGHISRAMELLPHLQQYGSVDIFLSGNNSQLVLDAPVKFRSKGISLYYNCNGGLDYWQLMRSLRPLRIREEIRDLPVDLYDIVLNDFDYITAAACARKGVPSVHFGHQASFQSPEVPRPLRRSRVGEWLLGHYVRATHHVGLHFERYAPFIFPPVVKKAVLEAEPTEAGHITVYLPSYCRPELGIIFGELRDQRFEIFSRDCRSEEEEGNLRFLPVSRERFTQSLLQSCGLITGAGFETPAEALHLGKKLLVIPIRGQYEQACNAAALSRLGITCLDTIGPEFSRRLRQWLEQPYLVQKDYSHSIPECLAHIFSLDLEQVAEETEDWGVEW